MEKVTPEAIAIWVIVAVVVALALLPLRRYMSKLTYISLALFALYFSFLLWITVIERESARNYQYELEIFWSYKAVLRGRKRLLWENFWNVVLFIPIGLLLSSVFPFQSRANEQEKECCRMLLVESGFG